MPCFKLKFWRSSCFWKWFAFSMLLGLAFVAGGVALWASSLDISKLENPLAQPTYIYDKDGNKVSQLSSSKTIPITIDQVPAHVIEAIISVEDRRFYEHQGVDFRAILRALVRDLKSRDLSEGGSTITQQLAKNLFLPSDKSFSRKLKEAGYAFKIESTLSKDLILESYLNNIYFGEGRWGIQNAARLYFGKDVSDLKLEEGAMLAGLLKAPSIYSPLSSMDKALLRRNLVITLMKEQNYISESQYTQTLTLPITLKKSLDGELSGQYAPYVDYVIEEAITRYGLTEDEILGNGLQIYTQMDQIVQQSAEAVYSDDQLFPPGKLEQIVQSGMTIVDHTNGGIRGLIGYRGKSQFRQFNHASQLKRQPGSTLKPLSVYGAALERGYKPYTPLYDGELNINGYMPQNLDNKMQGTLTMQAAIQNSSNIPAVWLLNELGIDAGIEFAQRAGIPLVKADKNLSFALGALTEGLSPLQMAQAYSCFPNLGIMHKTHAITKITTAEGKVLVQVKPESIQVTDATTAYTITLMLKNAVDNGTGKNAYLGRPTAGKTGSVELPPTKEFTGITKGVKDVWFVGYTPELTAAVWMGYDKTDREHYLTISGGSGPAVVFREVLKRSLSNKPVVAFKIPAGYQMNEMFPAKTNRDDDEDKSSDNKDGFKEFFKKYIIDRDFLQPKGKGKRNK